MMKPVKQILDELNVKGSANSDKSFMDFVGEHWVKPEDIHTEKPLSHLVITGHLFVEQQLNEMIDAIFPAGDSITNTFNFWQKVQVLCATGLINNDISNKLLALNKLRNQYAHKLNHEVTLTEVRKISLDKNTPSSKDWEENSGLTIILSIAKLSGSLTYDTHMIRALKNGGYFNFADAYFL